MLYVTLRTVIADAVPQLKTKKYKNQNWYERSPNGRARRASF